MRRAWFEPKRGKELSFHVDRPNIDILVSLEMAEINHGMPTLELLLSNPNGMGVNRLMREVNIVCRAGAENANFVQVKLFPKRLNEQYHRDIVAERVGGQEEQYALSGKVERTPGSRR